MSPSKRFEETKLQHIGSQEDSFECSACKHQFHYESVIREGSAYGDEPPVFCPFCGRRNSDA